MDIFENTDKAKDIHNSFKKNIDTKEKDSIIEKYKKEGISFEDVLVELESIINKLESSEVSLEESCRLYEKGISLSKYCEYLLKEAEGKWRYLKEQNGDFVEQEVPTDEINGFHKLDDEL